MSVYDEDTTALPSARPLKRSSSTISLPTPPQTRRRRKNAPKRSGSFSSDEDDTDIGEEPARGRALKRTRISQVNEDEDQDAFWASEGDKSKSESKASVSEPEPELEPAFEVDEDSDNETTSFLARRSMKQKARSTSATVSAPVSPPPSNRRPRGAKVAIPKTTAKAELLSSVTEEEEESEKTVAEMVISPAARAGSPLPETPSTPKGQIRSVLFSPMSVVRDSPDNPFLSSPGSPSASASACTEGSDNQGRVLEEKPTIQMVFRGVRKTFPNPYYDHERGRPKSPKPNSLLPPEHPDYSPDLRGHARNLWPAKREEPKTPTKPRASPSKTAGSSATMLNTPPMTMKRTTKSKSLSLVDSDDDDDGDGDLDDDEVLPVRPLRLFA